MPPRAVRVLAFVGAGVALLWLAEISPKVAVYSTAVIGLGVVLMRSSQLKQLTDSFAGIVH